MLKRLCSSRLLLIAATVSTFCCFFYVSNKHLRQQEVLFPYKGCDQINITKNDEQTRQQTRNETLPLPTVAHVTSPIDDLAVEYPQVQPGGRYKPSNQRTQKVAIIIPYRHRWFHLRILLFYLHSVLIEQNLEYGVFVLSQNDEGLFNKGILLNAGVLEITKLNDSYDCFIFQDVDLIPENSRCSYACAETPVHIAAAVSKYSYTFPSFLTVGGVSAFTLEQIKAVNGWSNLFYGWGGEDDDMANRIKEKFQNINRRSRDVCRFTSLPHSRDHGNPVNMKRFDTLVNSSMRIDTEGLNSVQYKLVEIKEHPTYTNISVDAIK